VDHSFVSGYRLHFRQEIPEFAVVYRNPVIQIKTDPLVCVVVQFFIKSPEFGLLFYELIPLRFQLFKNLIKLLKKINKRPIVLPCTDNAAVCKVPGTVSEPIPLSPSPCGGRPLSPVQDPTV